MTRWVWRAVVMGLVAGPMVAAATLGRSSLQRSPVRVAPPDRGAPGRGSPDGNLVRQALHQKERISWIPAEGGAHGVVRRQPNG